MLRRGGDAPCGAQPFDRGEHRAGLVRIAEQVPRAVDPRGPREPRGEVAGLQPHRSPLAEHRPLPDGVDERDDERAARRTHAVDAHAFGLELLGDPAAGAVIAQGRHQAHPHAPACKADRDVRPLPTDAQADGGLTVSAGGHGTGEADRDVDGGVAEDGDRHRCAHHGRRLANPSLVECQ